jgi:SulP family sulfate permease
MLSLSRFRPRLLDALQGYDSERLWRDIGAGLTVGIVALPLAMAFAMASGFKPEAGIWTAIIGGALVAALGGSAVQIAGPAGAFIVVVYGIIERHGMANLLVCTALAGVLLCLMGLFRLGALVRFVPVSIVIGFTNGIAVLIALSQLKDFLGLSITRMPAEFFAQWGTLGAHLHTLNPSALTLALICLIGLFLWPRLFGGQGRTGLALAMVGGRASLEALQLHRATRMAAKVPGPVVALISLSLASHLLELPVETIGSRFGGIPQTVPTLSLPAVSWDSIQHLLVPTLTLALLGAIESLLCARVADQIAGLPRHDANQELIAQGVANLVTPLIGGMPVTGTMARTVTNVRAGATSPVSALVHCLTLLLIVLLAAPLATHVPLAVLAGVLMSVALNMGDWPAFTRLRSQSRHHVLLMIGTFILTVVFDLTVALEVGLVLACILFVQRMSRLFRVECLAQDAQSVRFALHGSLFFGAVAKLDPVLSEIEARPRPTELMLDLSGLQSLDPSGLDALEQIRRAVEQRGGRLQCIGLQGEPLAVMRQGGWLEQGGQAPRDG